MEICKKKEIPADGENLSALVFTRLRLNKSFFVDSGPAPDCRLVDGLDIQAGSGAEVLKHH